MLKRDKQISLRKRNENEKKKKKQRKIHSQNLSSLKDGIDHTNPSLLELKRAVLTFCILNLLSEVKKKKIGDVSRLSCWL